MNDLRLSTLNAYRKPGGWVEFWVGLVVLIIFSSLCGRIIYMENWVAEKDAEFRKDKYGQAIEKSVEPPLNEN